MALLTIEHKVRTEQIANRDSIEIGTPGREGVIKVYCDFDNPEETRRKIANALAARKWTNETISKKEI